MVREVLRNGAALQQRTFASLGDLASLPERAVVNCMGYGARTVCDDDSMVPVAASSCTSPLRISATSWSATTAT